ncbi:hypothetical protein N7470_007527 [Penicillium chermesinum]|nr:hypothetical protein N7470_007527 [Penicillium chermesinum]
MAAPAGIDMNELDSNPRYLIRQPRALQWFEDGRLVKRHESERQAGRFELFLDLLYVAILSNFADTFVEDITGANLVKYILILAPSWHVWSDIRELMNSFYNDDLIQRILILWLMALLVVYGNNAPLVSEDIGAMRSAVGSYMVARLSCTIAHFYYSFASYHHRPQQRLWVVLSLVSLAIFIPLYFESVSIRGKIATAAVAVVFEELSWIFCFSPAAKKMLRVKYSTAVDIPHEVDRYAAFYIIALGEFLYLIVVGSHAADEPGTLALDKHLRMIMRPITAVIVILIPLARHLGATSVLSIIMALFVLCVVWESITSLRCGAHIWERWSETDYPERRRGDDTFKNGPGRELPSQEPSQKEPSP